MKAAKGSIARALEQPDPSIRLYLFHGPDEAQSRALGATLVEALKASRFLLAAGSVKSDPAVLADEAGAMNLFGGSRIIWIEPAGDEILVGVEALLELPAVESRVVVIAPGLRKTSTLAKLADASPYILSFAAWAPDGQEAGRLAMELGRRVGLKMAPHVGERIAHSCGNDQGIMARELEKLALYVDASPHSPKELDADALDAVGAEGPEGDFLKLADMALGGAIGELADELARLPATGSHAIPVVRSLQRRMMMLAPARARVERGERADAVMAALGKALFWKDKPLVSKMLAKWSAEDLAKLAERAGKLEHDLIFNDTPGHAALGEELLAIARKARSVR